MKRAFLVHGWDGDPNNHWFPWLKGQLEERGFTVTAPALPDPLNPRIEAWVPALAQAVGGVDDGTYLIGHSMGCQTILRFLETLPSDQIAGGAVLVAGFVGKLKNLKAEEKPVAKPWAETPIDLDMIKSRAKHFAVVLSDNDLWVPLESNREIFMEKLGAEVVVEHSRGHFEAENSVTELPIVLNLLQKWEIN